MRYYVVTGLFKFMLHHEFYMGTNNQTIYKMNYDTLMGEWFTYGGPGIQRKKRFELLHSVWLKRIRLSQKFERFWEISKMLSVCRLRSVKGGNKDTALENRMPWDSPVRRDLTWSWESGCVRIHGGIWSRSQWRGNHVSSVSASFVCRGGWGGAEGLTVSPVR